MPLFDSGVSGAVILVIAIVAVVAIVWLVDRRRRTGRRAQNRKASPLHGMAKDESLSYFRDFSATSSAPGVREEDRADRWGEGDPPPR